MVTKIKLGFAFLVLPLSLLSSRAESAALYTCAIELNSSQKLDKLLSKPVSLWPKHFSVIQKLGSNFFAEAYAFLDGSSSHKVELKKLILEHYGSFFSDLLGVVFLNQPEAACGPPGDFTKLAYWSYLTDGKDPQTKGTFLDPDPLTLRPGHFENQCYIDNPNPPSEREPLDRARTFVWTKYFKGLPQSKIRIYIIKVFKVLDRQIKEILRIGRFNDYPHSESLIEALITEFEREPMGNELMDYVVSVNVH